jgi:hypothetical protein
LLAFLLLLLQLALGGMFVAAGAAKVLQSDDFAGALRLSHLPEAVVVLLMIGIPALEIALAAWLFLADPAGLPRAFLASAALLVLFTVWMLWVSGRKLTVRCGCFGGGEGLVGPSTILRNVILLALALTGWLLARTVVSPLGGVSLPAVIAWSSLALAVALVQAGRLALPHMTLTYDQYRNSGIAESE